MKVLKTLHLVIDLFFLGLIIGVIFYLVLILPDLFDPDIRFTSEMSKYESFGKKAIYLLGMILKFCNFILFLFTVFSMRMIVSRFVNGLIYDIKTRKYFRNAGWATFSFGVIQFFMDEYWQAFLGNKAFNILHFSSEFRAFGSPYFIIILGLFFIYLAKVLETSHLLQKENELTI